MDGVAIILGRLLFLTASLFGLHACSSTEPEEGTPDAHDDAADSQGYPLDASAEHASMVCPSAGGGPAMIMVQAPDGRSYCIDATEVTQKQYSEFLVSTSVAPGSEHASCAWNKSYEPFVGNDTTPGQCVPPDGMGLAYFYDPLGTPNRPVTCIDWCDAWAFCTWAGKHLCGRTGGGVLALNEPVEAGFDEWFNACSNGGKTKWSYGNELDETACPIPNNNDPGHANALDVASVPTCTGINEPFSAVYDLSGNKAEWVAACSFDAGAGDSSICAITAGANPVPEMSRCDFRGTVSAQSTTPGIGFRCCWD